LTKQRKGIILAGGAGTRPASHHLSQSKQLLRVRQADDLLPLAALMAAGHPGVLDHQPRRATRSHSGTWLRDGEQWGISFQYAAQPEPNGIAQRCSSPSDF